MYHKTSKFYAAVFDYFLRSVQSTKGSYWHGICFYLCFGRYGMLFMLVFLFPSISWRNTTIMDQSLMTQFYFWGFFHFTHAQPLPHPTNNVGRLYPEFFSEYTIALSQGLLSRIVGSTLVYEKRRGGERWEATQGTRTLY